MATTASSIHWPGVVATGSNQNDGDVVVGWIDGGMWLNHEGVLEYGMVWGTLKMLVLKSTWPFEPKG
uniref:Uncharacterized protein n=1 Tax=Oryza sativa subsp. japonica TaxID=39947 RepID=Q6K555_ORYSJ|nr:hypothetical protein [Oryza sativa Japonica Group]